MAEEILSAIRAALDDVLHIQGGNTIADRVIEAMANRIPDNWAKVDGEWHHIPDEHFISIERKIAGSDVAGFDWRMEHSLPCRILGMKDCPVQEVWVAHLEEDGHWPKDGRFRIWITGEDTSREDVFEDTRIVHWEWVE
jgi:hypothetical protein